MRCVFCKGDSSTSKSREHIFPESLGNTTQVLPPGIVCDHCNYFSRKVEKPFLEHPSIRSLRCGQGIPSKRGNIPSIPGMLLPSFPAEIHRRLERGDLATTIDVSPDAFEFILRDGVESFSFLSVENLP
jgi:hypothetical protein